MTATLPAPPNSPDRPSWIPEQVQLATWQWRGYRIQWGVAGPESGPPLLLVHGFGASIGHWKQNIPSLVAAGQRVYVLDLLGFGASEKAPIDYSLELWEELLADFWAAQIQRPVVVVGNSIGALVALMLMANRPELVRGGILLNCAGGINHRPEELNPVLGAVMQVFAKVVSSPLTGPFLFNQIRQPRRIKNTLRQVYRNRAAITDELVEMLYRPSCDPGAQQVFASILTAPPGPSPAQLLPQVQVPLLVLWGEADPWTPISAAGLYRQAAQTQDLQFEAIADTGHCPHDDRPELVNPRILAWLAEKELR
jgi:pimeloyl-ACP methyl ester carboxylesterase